jgi:hypothetical protein
MPYDFSLAASHGFQLTTAEPAIVASVAAVLAAFVALLNGRGTRRQAREDRLWESRSNAYVDLLAWCIQRREMAKMAPVEIMRRLDSIVMPSAEDLIALEARVSCFASDRIDTKVDQLMPMWSRLSLALGDMKLLREHGVDDHAMRKSFSGIGQPEERWELARVEIETWSSELIRMIRSEQQSLRAMKPSLARFSVRTGSGQEPR